MELGNSRGRYGQNFRDLAHGHVLEVVEDDHRQLRLGQIFFAMMVLGRLVEGDHVAGLRMGLKIGQLGLVEAQRVGEFRLGRVTVKLRYEARCNTRNTFLVFMHGSRCPIPTT